MNALSRRLDAIAALWLSTSQAEISRRLKVSTGTVSGLVARARKAGDPRFPPRPNPKAAPKRKIRKLKPADEVVGNAKPPRPEPTPPKPVPFSELRPGQCRFPMNSPERGGQFLFCAAPVSRRDYCAAHAAQTRVSGTRPPFSASRPRGFKR